MPGVPGAGGPIPKRSSQRRRVNKPETPTSEAPGAVEVPIPSADEVWHPLARDWFGSLTKSGQAAFYEPSDWAQARVLAHLLSVQLWSAKPSAMMIAAWQSGATELLTTEGARRRMRIELARAVKVDEAQEHSDATITDIASRLKA